MKSYWRTQARPIIASVLAATSGQDERAIRKALRDAYPFGSRDHHPYKIWLDEIKLQRGLRKATTSSRLQQPSDPRQLRFET